MNDLTMTNVWLGILAVISLIEFLMIAAAGLFAFKAYMLWTAPLLMAVAIMMLELFVAFLQAFIFALLSSVFIGLIREGAH